jgi:hypothetical protein
MNEIFKSKFHKTNKKNKGGYKNSVIYFVALLTNKDAPSFNIDAYIRAKN